MEHPEWLFGAIGEVREGDYFIFDCPGEVEFHAHLNVLKVFAAMLVVKNFRTCVVRQFLFSSPMFTLHIKFHCKSWKM